MTSVHSLLPVIVVSALPTILAVMLWALSDLESFVLVAVLGAIVFPASLAKPGGSNVDAADILLVLALASWLISHTLGQTCAPWLKRNPLLPAAVAYVALNAMSIAWSIKTRSTIVFTVQLIELIIVYPVVLATIPTSLERIRRSMLLIVALTCGQAIAAVAVYVSNPGSRATGTYLPGINKNALGSFVAAGTVLAYALWLRERPGRGRTFLGLALLLELAGTLATGSRGALLGVVVAIPFMSFLLARGRVLAVAVLVAAAGAFFVLVAPNQARKANAAGGYNSSLIRSLSYRDAVKYIERHPVLGTGARTYSDTLNGYGTIPDPNNLLLLTWAELGIIGIAALGYLLFRIATLFVRAKRLPPDAAALAIGAGGVAVSLLVHFQVDISWVRGETTLEFAMLGVMMAVIRLAAPPHRGESTLSDTAADPSREEQLVGGAVA